MMLSKFPAVDASGFGGEVDTDLENCLSFGKERTVIAHSLNLLFFWGSIGSKTEGNRVPLPHSDIRENIV